jgi:hypothetical protein
MTSIDKAKAVLDSIGAIKPREFSESELAHALLQVAEDLLNTRQGVSMRGADGAPDWRGFETALWQASEKLRTVVSARKDWRGECQIVLALAQLARDKRFGKGRQNIVLMLGEFGGSNFAPLLSELLDDPEVRGHAIKALIKSGCTNFFRQVDELLPQLDGWARKAAIQYLKKSSPPPL